MDVDAVSRLLSLTSHELRSPLGVIRGYLKLLEQRPESLTEPQKQAVAASLRATERMVDILAEVSAFAHLQRGDTPLDRQATTLGAVAAAAALPNTPAITTEGAVAQAELLADLSLLGPALGSVAAAVQAARPRETSLPVAIRVEPRDGTTFGRLTIGQLPEGALTSAPVNLLRGGLGLRLPLASTVIAAHGGLIEEVQQNGRLLAMVVWLPLRQA